MKVLSRADAVISISAGALVSIFAAVDAEAVVDAGTGAGTVMSAGAGASRIASI